MSDASPRLLERPSGRRVAVSLWRGQGTPTLDALQSTELESVGGPQHPEPVTEPQTASKQATSHGPKARTSRLPARLAKGWSYGELFQGSSRPTGGRGRLRSRAGGRARWRRRSADPRATTGRRAAYPLYPPSGEPFPSPKRTGSQPRGAGRRGFGIRSWSQARVRPRPSPTVCPLKTAIVGLRRPFNVAKTERPACPTCCPSAIRGQCLRFSGVP